MLHKFKKFKWCTLSVIYSKYNDERIYSKNIEWNFLSFSNRNFTGSVSCTKTLIGKETKVKGIVMLSSFYLPEDYKIRVKIYKDLLKMRKTFHFILDEITLKKKSDINKVEEFLIFNNSFFTETKTKLNSYEKKFMKKFKNINFV